MSECIVQHFKETLMIIAMVSLVLAALLGSFAGIWGINIGQEQIQNQAIEKGYAEIRVINGERKFQWK